MFTHAGSKQINYQIFVSFITPRVSSINYQDYISRRKLALFFRFQNQIEFVWRASEENRKATENTLWAVVK